MIKCLYYSLRTWFSCWMFSENFTQVFITSGRLRASIISFTHPETNGCETILSISKNILLPTGDWYEPVPKQLNAIRT